jgi:hypothetical protein
MNQRRYTGMQAYFYDYILSLRRIALFFVSLPASILLLFKKLMYQNSAAAGLTHSCASAV